MLTNHTTESLQAFEKKIESLYNQSLIAAPIHLRGGNEQILIDIFNREDIKEEDWLTGCWGMHLECLLKNTPEEELTQAILDKRSITLNFKKQRIVTSAIVSSVVPISVGISMGIKRKGLKERVFCAVGDMGFLSGIAQESIRYAMNFDLPIKFIVGDNQISVKTPTKDVWGLKDGEVEQICKQYSNVIYYKYTNTYFHSGTGVRINFW